MWNVDQQGPLFRFQKIRKPKNISLGLFLSISDMSTYHMLTRSKSRLEKELKRGNAGRKLAPAGGIGQVAVVINSGKMKCYKVENISTGFVKLEAILEAVEALVKAVEETRKRGEEQMGIAGGIQIVMN